MDIHWIFIINTTKPNKIDNTIQLINSTIGDINVVEKGTYWKNEKQTKIVCHQQLYPENTSKLLLHILTMCSLFSSQWSFLLPDEYEMDEFDLSAVCDHVERVQNIDWINVEINHT